jgi:hypothetical protein
MGVGYNYIGLITQRFDFITSEITITFEVLPMNIVNINHAIFSYIAF